MPTEQDFPSLKGKEECFRSQPHICEKHPEDCDNVYWQEDVFANTIDKAKVREAIEKIKHSAFIEHLTEKQQEELWNCLKELGL